MLALEILFLIIFFVCFRLEVRKGVDLYATEKSVHALLLVTCIYILGLLLWESIRYKNESAWIQLSSLGLLLAAGICEIVWFYRVDWIDASGFVQVGVLLYVVSLGITSTETFAARKWSTPNGIIWPGWLWWTY